MKYQFLIIVTSVFLFACNRKTEKKLSSQIDSVKKESLSRYKRDTLNILKRLRVSIKDTSKTTEVTFIKDTLNIVSRDRFLYYPFGEFDTIKNIKSILSSSNFKIKKLPRLGENDSVTAFQFSSGSSYINFLKGTESGKMELLSGKITNGVWKLKNGIKTGMSKRQFLNQFFGDVPDIDIKYIRMESLVLGILHYYTFQNDKLVSIAFKTDYLIGNK
ncbi:MAG: hypothetical protein WC615_18395 [Mucilaginibacter sp.]|jgi:hypothetical protein|uniref:hypothetical protein n=1 Tax=Mucilaginibacter sp. TaxID=1882438 RepID=UPI00356563DF